MRKLEEVDVSTLVVSPFVGLLRFSATRFSGNQYKLDDGVMMPVDYMVEKQESCKLYRDLDINQMLMGLSYRALQLFNWVALMIKKDSDWIQINEDLFCKRTNITSRKTYVKAVEELLMYQILIGTHYKTVYWVNPNYLFNGDRLKKYPKNVKIYEF